MSVTCKPKEHTWELLYETEHIRVWRCETCGLDEFQESPFKDA